MRYIWLHGFASGPTSSKGQFMRRRMEERGLHLVLPDLNAPAFGELTVSRMLRQVDELVQGEPPDSDKKARPVVLFGSSLGGFTAATWAATRPGRVHKLVLLAPAFDLADRWVERMGADAEKWRRDGTFEFDHYAHGGKEPLSYEFIRDARKYEPFPIPDCPTLVFQGTRDDTVDPSLAREFVKRTTGRAFLVELDEGHELTGDLPAMWRRIEQFLFP